MNSATQQQPSAVHLDAQDQADLNQVAEHMGVIVAVCTATVDQLTRLVGAGRAKAMLGAIVNATDTCVKSTTNQVSRQKKALILPPDFTKEQ